MLRDDYECLGIAANMTPLIELNQFFTCDVLLTSIRIGMIFYEIIRQNGN